MLRIAVGLTALLAGADKFTHLLTNWSMYLSPAIARLLPASAETFMRAAGVIEVVVGIAILTRWARLGGFVAAAWLTAITANLVVAGFYDVAVRDLVMAVGAFSLGMLSEPAAATQASVAPRRREAA